MAASVEIAVVCLLIFFQIFIEHIGLQVSASALTRTFPFDIKKTGLRHHGNEVIHKNILHSRHKRELKHFINSYIKLHKRDLLSENLRRDYSRDDYNNWRTNYSPNGIETYKDQQRPGGRKNYYGDSPANQRQPEMPYQGKYPNSYQEPYPGNAVDNHGREKSSYYRSGQDDYRRQNSPYVDSRSKEENSDSVTKKLEKLSKSKVVVPERFGVPKQVAGFWDDTPKAEDAATDGEKRLLSDIARAEGQKFHRIGFGPSKFSTQFDLEKKTQSQRKQEPQDYQNPPRGYPRQQYPNGYRGPSYNKWNDEDDSMLSNRYQHRPGDGVRPYGERPPKFPYGDFKNTVPERVRNHNLADIIHAENELRPKKKAPTVPHPHQGLAAPQNTGRSGHVDGDSAKINQDSGQSETLSGSTEVEVHNQNDVPMPPKSKAWLLAHPEVLKTSPGYDNIKITRSSTTTPPTTTTTEGIPMPPKSQTWIRKQQLIAEEKALQDEFEQVEDRLAEAVNASANSSNHEEIRGEVEKAQEIIRKEKHIRGEEEVVEYEEGLEEGENVTLATPSDNQGPYRNRIDGAYNRNEENGTADNKILEGKNDRFGLEQHDIKSNEDENLTNYEKRQKYLEEERRAMLERHRSNLGSKGNFSSDEAHVVGAARPETREREGDTVLSQQNVGTPQISQNKEDTDRNMFRSEKEDNLLVDDYKIKDGEVTGHNEQNPNQGMRENVDTKSISLDDFLRRRKTNGPSPNGIAARQGTSRNGKGEISASQHIGKIALNEKAETTSASEGSNKHIDASKSIDDGTNNDNLQPSVQIAAEKTDEKSISLDDFLRMRKTDGPSPIPNTESKSEGRNLVPRDPVKKTEEDVEEDDADLQEFARLWMESNHRRKRDTSDVLKKTASVGGLGIRLKDNPRKGGSDNGPADVGANNQGIINGQVVALPAKAGGARLKAVVKKNYVAEPLMEVKTERIGVPKQVAGFWYDTQSDDDHSKSKTAVDTQELTKQLLARRKLSQVVPRQRPFKGNKVPRRRPDADTYDIPGIGKSPFGNHHLEKQRSLQIALKQRKLLAHSPARQPVPESSHLESDEQESSKSIKSSKVYEAPVPVPIHQHVDDNPAVHVPKEQVKEPVNVPERTIMNADTDVDIPKSIPKYVLHNVKNPVSSILNENQIPSYQQDNNPSEQESLLKEKKASLLELPMKDTETKDSFLKGSPKFALYNNVNQNDFKRKLLQDPTVRQNPRIHLDAQVPVPLSSDTSLSAHQYHSEVKESVIETTAKNDTLGNGTSSGTGFQLLNASYYKNLMRRYRSQDSFWALLSLAVLLFVLFSAVWYSKMWRKKDGDWNFKGKYEPETGISVKEILKAKLSLLPDLRVHLKRKRKPKVKGKASIGQQYLQLVRKGASNKTSSSDEEVLYKQI